MERALLQGERQAELDQIETEADIIAQLQHKLDELESAIQREKDKVHESGGRADELQVYFSSQRLNTHTHCLCFQSSLTGSSLSVFLSILDY